MIELVAEDGAGKPIADLWVDELEVLHAGVVQELQAFEYDDQRGLYHLEYRPHDGALAPVEVRVKRPGIRVRGAEAPMMRPRWVASSIHTEELAGEMRAWQERDDGAMMERTADGDPRASAPVEPIRLGTHAPRKIRHVAPVYPALARQKRINGDVILEIVIDVEGRVVAIRSAEGAPELLEAARAATRQWLYEPTLRDGKPVPVVATVTVSFRIS